MNTFTQIVGVVVMAIVTIIFFGLLLSYPVMLLWNGCLVGTVSGIQSIGWLQAWGIMILCGILFKPTSASVKSE